MAKKPKTLVSARHAFNYIKLCYLLILTVAMYGLKLQVYPESDYEMLFALTKTNFLIESVAWALIISIAFSVILLKKFKENAN
ncbi:MAG: hypothetical protein J6A54_02040 [Clostridia bacterium]|nr:hypothetical protein [Clostridia bacterium]